MMTDSDLKFQTNGLVYLATQASAQITYFISIIFFP